MGSYKRSIPVSQASPALSCHVDSSSAQVPVTQVNSQIFQVGAPTKETAETGRLDSEPG